MSLEKEKKIPCTFITAKTTEANSRFVCELFLLSYHVSVINIRHYKWDFIWKKKQYRSEKETIDHSNSSKENYREIPKISLSMYKPLQI